MNWQFKNNIVVVLECKLLLKIFNSQVTNFIFDVWLLVFPFSCMHFLGNLLPITIPSFAFP